MWTSILRSLITGYFVISLTTLQQAGNLVELDLKAKIMCIGNLFIVVLFPIVCYVFLKTNLNYLETPKLKLKYGTLYENVYVRNNKSKAF